MILQQSYYERDTFYTLTGVPSPTPSPVDMKPIRRAIVKPVRRSTVSVAMEES